MVSRLLKIWARAEETIVVFSLTMMTLVTFFYVVFNNLYEPLYQLGDAFPSLDAYAYVMGDFVMTLAQEMTWSIALTKVFFAWLIFFGASYCVRVSAHIGIDAFVKLFSYPWQRRISLVACLGCLLYAILAIIASYDWIVIMFKAQIGAEDLSFLGVKTWHLGLVIPIGYFFILLRLFEVFIALCLGNKTLIGLADETEDALHATTCDKE